MVKKALLIGINYYRSLQPKLKGCIDDIVNMRNLLVDAYAYDLSDITLLRDDIINPKLMPTKRNIIDALNNLVANSSTYTEFWFLYSGHGANIEKDSVIIPSDYSIAGVITDNELYAIFKNTKCRCFLLFDSCNSGNIVELPWRYEYVSPNQIVKTNVNNHILANTEIYLFAGCKETQTCGDIYSQNEAEYVGVFTEAFLTCLRQNKHEVDLLKLYMDIGTFLFENKRIQTPIFASSILDPSYSLDRA